MVYSPAGINPDSQRLPVLADGIISHVDTHDTYPKRSLVDKKAAKPCCHAWRVATVPLG